MNAVVTYRDMIVQNYLHYPAEWPVDVAIELTELGVLCTAASPDGA
jgi:hypothetical protein